MVEYKLGQYPERERDRRVCDNILDIFRNKGNNKDIPVTESSDSEEEIPKPRDPIQSTQTTVASEEKQQDDQPNKELETSKEESVPEPEENPLPVISDDEVDEVKEEENLPEPEPIGVNVEKRGISSDEEKGASQGSAVVESPKSVVSDDEVDEVTKTPSENLPEVQPDSDGGSDVDEIIEKQRRGSRPDPQSIHVELKNATEGQGAISEGDEVDEVENPTIFKTAAVQGVNESIPMEPPKDTEDTENLPEKVDSDSEPEKETEPGIVPGSNDPVPFNPENVVEVPAPVPDTDLSKPVQPKSISNPTQPIVVPELAKKEEAIKQMQSIKRRRGVVV